jgi:hypothetical protein
MKNPARFLPIDVWYLSNDNSADLTEATVNGLLPFPGFFENLVLITNALKWLWNEF